jgi:hypothetical protein
MVWSIPLTELAGALAVSFTAAAPPVQRPTSAPPELPDAPPASAPEDPMPPEVGPPPQLPPVDDPEPPATTSPVVNDPFTETRAPRRPPPVPEATDDEVAPRFAGASAVPPKQRMLRPTDKRRFFSLTAGGATASSYYSSYYSGLGGGMDFQAEMAVGSHGLNRPHLGGAFVLQYRKGFLTEITLGGRVQWDKPLSKAFAIYSTTDLTLGLNIPIGYGGYLSPMLPNAIATLGWGLKAVLGERILLIFKPVGPGLMAPAYSQIRVSFRWELGGGIGIVW